MGNKLTLPSVRAMSAICWTITPAPTLYCLRLLMFTGSHCVVEMGLQLLTPLSHRPNAWIIGMQHQALLIGTFCTLKIT